MTKLRQLWLLTALGSLAALVGGYFLLISPQLKEASALRGETEAQLRANRQLKSEIDMLNKQKKDLPAQQAKLAKFAALIPTNPAMPALVRSLSDAADHAGVELVSINPKLPEYAKAVNTQTRVETPGRVPAPNGTVLVDIPLDLRVVGSYTQLTQFFTEVEELNRALLVRGFRIARAEAGRKTGSGPAVDDPNVLHAEIQAHVLMTRKAPAVVAPVDTSSTDEK